VAVVKANYVRRNANERATAKANIRYIQQRPGHDKEKLTRVLFGPAGILGRLEAYQFIHDAPKGTLFYRLKLSPDPATEDVKRDLNMHKLTRSMMKNLEKRLTTAIPWAAALHDDHTTIRHIHILAAIPRRLHKYELEYLIKEATHLSLSQRRFLDRGTSRLPWQEHSASQRIKTGKYTSYQTAVRHNDRNSLPHRMVRGGRPAPTHSSCTCPRCHFSQLHTGQQGRHQCMSCGVMLHKKQGLSLQRRKGREWERSL
jgi:hypothetical protein